jgi:hypothetical protein
MSDDDDFKDYPKARLAVGPGDLIDVYDVSMTWEDGEKIVATLRANPSGSVVGTKSGLMAFKSSISSAGFERDFLGPYEKRQVMRLRLKLPAKVITLVGRYTKPAITSNVDNFIDFSISCLGRGRAVDA